MPDTVFDLAIIGGGINGCGIARDAVGRGHSVYLCEQDDLASGTSNWSTKLIHGGLRYLEHYEFRLVREALIEREVLWRIAPHIVQPLRFVLPHHQGLRPAWLLRLGLFLYDHLGGRKLLPATRTLDLRTDKAGAALTPGHARGFEYSDCQVDDARLVVLNARDAADRGARIETRTRAVGAERHAGHWRLTVEQAGRRRDIHARVLVNAAGPWVERVLNQTVKLNAPAHVRLVQGSHIVVPRLTDHDRAYIFQNADGRIIFAIPWQDAFTLIGTTDRDYAGDPAAVTASAEEIAYLCAAASEYFARGVTPADVVWTYSGVRPLYDDGASAAQEATRDYVLVRDAPQGQAALLSVFGGKITTYRRLAESALAELAGDLPRRAGLAEGWTADAALPGGDFPVDGRPALAARLYARFPALSVETARRLVGLYGTTAFDLMAQGPGQLFGPHLMQAEVDHLIAREWALSADDILWRRTKLGLTMTAEGRAALESYLAASRVPASA
jgi:glycerol-3-phosphate dehydrogenase